MIRRVESLWHEYLWLDPNVRNRMFLIFVEGRRERTVSLSLLSHVTFLGCYVSCIQCSMKNHKLNLFRIFRCLFSILLQFLRYFTSISYFNIKYGLDLKMKMIIKGSIVPDRGCRIYKHSDWFIRV